MRLHTENYYSSIASHRKHYPKPCRTQWESLILLVDPTPKNKRVWNQTSAKIETVDTKGAYGRDGQLITSFFTPSPQESYDPQRSSRSRQRQNAQSPAAGRFQRRSHPHPHTTPTGTGRIGKARSLLLHGITGEDGHSD